MLKKEKKAAERERRLRERELAEKEGQPWPVKRKRLDKDVGTQCPSSHILRFPSPPSMDFGIRHLLPLEQKS